MPARWPIWALLDIVNEPTAAALGFGEVLGYLESGSRGRRTR